MKVRVNKDHAAAASKAFLNVKSGMPRANVRAINRSLSPTMTMAVKLIGRDLNLKAARIKKDFYQIKATMGKPSGAVMAKGEPVGLYQFATPAGKKLYTLNSHPKTGVKVKVKKHGKAKMLKHTFATKIKNIKASTLQKDPDAGNQLFWREDFGGKRTRTGDKYARYFASLPQGHKFKPKLKRLSGPRIEDIYANKGIFDPTVKHAAETYEKQVDAAIKDILRRENG